MTAASEVELAAAAVSAEEVEAVPVPAPEPLGMVRASGRPARAGRGTVIRRSPEAVAAAAAAAVQEAPPVA